MGGHYPAPNFPSFGRHQSFMTLPDPFQFSGGWRDTLVRKPRSGDATEIMAAIEKYKVGPVPDCSDTP